jgi:hypothetical protein
MTSIWEALANSEHRSDVVQAIPTHLALSSR